MTPTSTERALAAKIAERLWFDFGITTTTKVSRVLLHGRASDIRAEIADVLAEQRAKPRKKGWARMSGKNPAAVALGRLGGAKGGKARADKLSKARRVEIAKAAAAARWSKARYCPDKRS